MIQVLNGIQNPMCDVCWKQEETGTSSYRTSYIKKYKNDTIDYNNPKITYEIKLM